MLLWYIQQKNLLNRNNGENISLENELNYFTNKLQCDVPTWTIQNMLENIRDQHGSEIEYIMVRHLVIALWQHEDYNVDDEIGTKVI